MGSGGQRDGFQFIDMSRPDSLRDVGVRRIIRKQAMKDTAVARRQNGTYGKKNLRQLPMFIENADEIVQKQFESPRWTWLGSKSPDNHALSKDNSEPQSQHQKVKPRHEREVPAHLRHQVSSIPASLSSTGYEAVRSQYDFDILDLSALTGFHTGPLTAKALSDNPSRLIDILHCRQWSFFAFIPSQFGHSPCLDDATRCVTARVRQWLSPSPAPRASVLSLYSRALMSLQAALDDPQRCLKPDVLCATEILAIYEVVHGRSCMSHRY